MGGGGSLSVHHGWGGGGEGVPVSASRFVVAVSASRFVVPVSASRFVSAPCSLLFGPRGPVQFAWRRAKGSGRAAWGGGKKASYCPVSLCTSSPKHFVHTALFVFRSRGDPPPPPPPPPSRLEGSCGFCMLIFCAECDCFVWVVFVSISSSPFPSFSPLPICFV